MVSLGLFQFHWICGYPCLILSWFTVYFGKGKDSLGSFRVILLEGFIFRLEPLQVMENMCKTLWCWHCLRYCKCKNTRRYREFNILHVVSLISLRKKRAKATYILYTYIYIYVRSRAWSSVNFGQTSTLSRTIFDEFVIWIFTNSVTAPRLNTASKASTPWDAALKGNCLTRPNGLTSCRATGKHWKTLGMERHKENYRVTSMTAAKKNIIRISLPLPTLPAPR